MDWDVLSGTKWNILTALQHVNEMETLATETRTSRSNVSNHLQLLEALGYVAKERRSDGSPGKPVNEYRIDDCLGFGGVIDQDVVHRTSFSFETPVQALMWKTLVVVEPSDFYHVSAFLTSGAVDVVEALSYVRRSRAKIELFALASDVEAFRSEYSNVETEAPDGSTKEVVCWTHTTDEVADGLERDDDYYLDLVTNGVVLYDPDELMRWNV